MSQRFSFQQWPWIVGGGLLALVGAVLLWRLLYRPLLHKFTRAPAPVSAQMVTPTSPPIEPLFSLPSAASPSTNAVSIDLVPFYNAGLTNAVMMGIRDHPNNLAEFPVGEHDFGGVRFIVQGMIQLGTIYPSRVQGVKVDARAQRLHLLHGTGGAPPEGSTVALLTLHFADGSADDLPLIYGEHLRDWWAWKKNEPVELDSGSRIAWEGSNDFARSKNCKIRVYRSTLTNPHPELVIETLDYERVGRCGPFLLGLSVD